MKPGRLWIIILATLFSGCAKKSLPVIALQHAKAMDTLLADYSTIDSLLDDKTVVGAGEATHGTHEFAVVRSELFKYLVTKKGFNTFFLEADYGACLRINRYVQGGVDSAAHAIANIRLWPFTTMEMLEVIAWMREFNAKNPDRMLSFRGCDMQYGRDDSAELMRLMRKYDIPLRTPPSLPGTGDHDSSTSVAREKMRDCIAFVDSAQILFSGIRMLRSDSVDLQMLLKGLAFYFQKTNTKAQERRAFRDSCMASNILEFLRSDPSNRIFLWAHNGHIAHARSNMAETKPCGYFLRSALANKYLAIGTEMNEGMIYAMSWNSELHQYVPKNSYLKAAPKHTLPWLLAKKNMEMLYLEVQHLQYPNQWKMTAIGGAYPLSHDGTQVQRFSRLLSGFDGIIYVNSTTALQVISRK